MQTQAHNCTANVAFVRIIWRKNLFLFFLLLSRYFFTTLCKYDSHFYEKATNSKIFRARSILFVVDEVEVTADYDVIDSQPTIVSETICQAYHCSPETKNGIENLVLQEKNIFYNNLYQEIKESFITKDSEDEPPWLSHADKTCSQQYHKRVYAAKQILARNLTITDEFCRSGDLAFAKSIGACPLAIAREATGGKPDAELDATGWFLVAKALFYAAEWEVAKSALLVMVESNPSSVLLTDAGLVMGAICTSQGRLDLAARAYHRILLNPVVMPHLHTVVEIKVSTMIPPILLSFQHLKEFRNQWIELVMDVSNRLESVFSPGFEEKSLVNVSSYLIPRPSEDVGSTVFHLSHQGENDIEFQVLLAKLYVLASPDLLYIAPHCVQKSGQRMPGPLRVGFLSMHLSDHSIGRMMAGLIVGISQTQPNIEVHVLSFHERKDQVSDFILSGTKHHHVLSTNTQQARLSIALLALDVLVYCDIGLEPVSYFLAFSRVSHVQMVWWGHPSTTALPHMDYFISLDNEVENAAVDHYSEQLIRMSFINVAYFTPIDHGFSEKTFQQLGLPEGKTIYMVLGRLFKVHPSFDSAIVGILKADSKAIVVLIAEKKADDLTAILWHRLQPILAKEGVEERLWFIHHWNYVEVLSIAAVVLDTFPYGGCLTSLEALAHAKPLVTLPSEYVRGRFTLAMYEQMGFLDLVSENVDDYINLSVSIGTNTTYQNELKQKIRKYYALLHENDNSVQEWSELFWKVTGMQIEHA